MGEEKWAPTPWVTDIGECFRIRDSNGGQIAMITFLGNGGRFGPRREDPEPWHTLHLMTAAPELYGQHEADITDIDMLIKAIKHDDPKRELLMRCEDIKWHKQKTMRKARGESGDDQ